MHKTQFRVLYREFLFRMVDLEVLSADALGDANKLVGQIAALLVHFSILLSVGAVLFMMARITPLQSLASTMLAEHFLISTTMLAVGLFAVLSWDSTFPDRRDVLVLAPLPVRARTMFLAKVAAVGTALLLTVGLMHWGSGVMWSAAFAAQAKPQSVAAMTYEVTPAPVSAANLPAVLHRDLRQQLTSGVLAPGTGSGLVAGVVQHGVRRVFAYGSAKPDSIFEIASITKTFTGLLLARMVAEGKVSLDEPLRMLLPPGMVDPPRGQEITLLDLATHHSGLPRVAAGGWREFLERRGVGKPPHPDFSYSNLGFQLLGYALAARAGSTYPDLLRDRIAAPLGLSDTVIDLSPAQRARVLQGYDESHRPTPPDKWDLPGAGAIYSTAGDLLTYLEANLHPENIGGGLGAALAMSHRRRDAGPPGDGIGLAWWIDPSGTTWLHGGAELGFTSVVFFDPTADLAAVVLLNNGPGAVPLAELLSSHIQQRMLGRPAVSLDSVLMPARGLPRFFAAYWLTMLAAGAFIYCSVLSVQGLAAQFLPRRLFLRASGVLQLVAFCVFVGVYFLEPAFGGLEGMSSAQIHRQLEWMPTYWFLGMFQQWNGTMHPLLAPLARRAWVGLAIAVCTASVAYGLSYVRSLKQIVEEPDIVPGGRRWSWLPPFGNRPQTAIGQFAVRTLARSRQHRMILAFYLGIGLALTVFQVKTPVRTPGSGAVNAAAEADAPLIAASIVMMALVVVGTRIAFALPLELRANWVFRIAGVRWGAKAMAATRRALLLLTVGPIWLLSAALCLHYWPWQQAAGHLALLALMGVLLAELCLARFPKIPFTCSYLPGKSGVHMIFLAALGLFYVVTFCTRYEQWALGNGRGIAAMLAMFAAAFVLVRCATAVLARHSDEDLRFEEEVEPAVQVLGLSR